MDQFRFEPEFIGRLASAIFFAVLFLQSGLDKASDWKGNLEWLTGHFSKSIFKGSVKPMLLALTTIELVAGILSAAGAVVLVISGNGKIAFYGIALSALALLMLFTGQRIAKDYAGAASLAIYFAVVLLSLLV